MAEVSIICCYTSEEQLAYLATSLDMQSIPCERIFIDNSSQRFTSASSALNYGAQQSSGDLLLFVHQDVRFKDETALEDFVHLCERLQPGDVAGVAGAIKLKGRKVTKTNITHSVDELPYAEIDFLDGDSLEVESIDECVIALPRSTWLLHPFDEDLCDDWHCYGVEQSLFARKNGHKVYVFDARVNHLSSAGTLGSSFMASMRKLVNYYASDFDEVVATTGIWPVRGLWATMAYVRLRESAKLTLRKLRARG